MRYAMCLSILISLISGSSVCLASSIRAQSKYETLAQEYSVSRPALPGDFVDPARVVIYGEIKFPRCQGISATSPDVVFKAPSPILGRISGEWTIEGLKSKDLYFIKWAAIPEGYDFAYAGKDRYIEAQAKEHWLLQPGPEFSQIVRDARNKILEKATFRIFRDRFTIVKIDDPNLTRSTYFFCNQQ